MPLLASGIFQFYSIFLGTLLDAFGIWVPSTWIGAARVQVCLFAWSEVQLRGAFCLKLCNYCNEGGAFFKKDIMMMYHNGLHNRLG